MINKCNSKNSNLIFKYVVIFFSLLSGSSVFAFENSMREKDPVIILGEELSSFGSSNPDEIIGFAFKNNNWVQIPIQIDERDERDVVSPYGASAGVYSSTFPASVTNTTDLYYVDITTEIGADSNPHFDQDDELVFMARDMGDRANIHYPDNVDKNSCLEIEARDTIDNLKKYVYLCESLFGFDQSAGEDYVSIISDVRSTVGFPKNDNPFLNTEDTLIEADTYSWHYNAEWVSDEFNIGSSSVDILDNRDVVSMVNGSASCNRNTQTYSDAENAYIAIKDGPVRVIRSIMGANSGSMTYRNHFFYDARHDTDTVTRVHPFGVTVSFSDVYDYNSSVSGMTYSNNKQAIGDLPVIIDGITDVLIQDSNDLEWEQVSGSLGTLSHIHRYQTDATESEFDFESYYEDNAVSAAYQCGNGDDQSWGMSGNGVTISNSACSDPLNPSCTNLHSLRTQLVTYIDEPGIIDPERASSYNDYYSSFLSINVNSYLPGNSSSKSGSRRKFSCKDITASNYDRFGAQKNSLCEYASDKQFKKAHLLSLLSHLYELLTIKN